MNALKNINTILEPVILGEEDANQGHMIKVCKELPKIHEALERGGGEEELNRIRMNREHSERLWNLRNEKKESENKFMMYINRHLGDCYVGRCSDCDEIGCEEQKYYDRELTIIPELNNDYIRHGERQYCEECIDDKCRVCMDCGDWRVNDTIFEIDECFSGGTEFICADCVYHKEEYFSCEFCASYRHTCERGDIDNCECCLECIEGQMKVNNYYLEDNEGEDLVKVSSFYSKYNEIDEEEKQRQLIEYRKRRRGSAVNLIKSVYKGYKTRKYLREIKCPDIHFRTYEEWEEYCVNEIKRIKEYLSGERVCSPQSQLAIHIFK